MLGTASSTTLQSSSAEVASTRLVFFIAGFCLASWAPLVPLLKVRAVLDEGVLGLLLLGLGIGSILAMPIAGGLVSRWGCRRVIVSGTLVLLAMLPLLATLSSVTLLLPALIIFGIGMGALDCAMNIQAVEVNAQSPKPIMSSFHGLFSLGGILGALSMTAMLKLGFTPLHAVLSVVGVSLVALYRSLPGLLQAGEKQSAPLFAIPRGEVLFLGALCFIVFLAEGAMLDWSGLYLVSHQHLQPELAGLAYATFAAAMTAGRLLGDRIVAAAGRRRVVGAGGALAAAGMLVSLATDTWGISLVGYGLIGLGCANIVPVLFAAVADQQSMPKAVAIPAMTTVGYAGVLVGPAFIGFVAHLSSLQLSLGTVALGLIGVAVSGRFVRR
ncbi:MAG TPA: MFS transporter [Pseudomonas sp.]|uniref:MFS transporter n=1 Tax=Pseudomonas sp. TaxID=306 RepID=UPI002B4925DC|nr:MFS transporter [Pseudomonas sp.]HKS12575.1 MFS transporter [Pseudomonas sp.]